MAKAITKSAATPKVASKVASKTPAPTTRVGQIAAPNFNRAHFHIKGTVPYVQAAFSRRVLAKMISYCRFFGPAFIITPPRP